MLGVGSADAADEPARGLVYAQFGLAVILLLGAARRWRKRPKPGEPHDVPKWMDSVRSIGPRRAFVLGIGLIALNPKDGLLTVAAGARLAEADPGAAAGAVALVIFVAVSSSTIAAPIAATLVSGVRAAPVLERWRAGLERHGQVAVAAVLLVLGIAVGVDAAREL
jgi:threonine/homoserine/homoserine lactone efflux protein